MKVAHVVTGLDNPAAGTSYSVLRLAAGLAERGVSGEVLSLLPICDELAARADVVGFPRLPLMPRLGLSPAMRHGLSACKATLLHNHGLWMMPSVYAGAVARRQRIPLVFSPRGMFSEWAMAFSRRRKQVAWWCLGQRQAVAATACFHATSESEATEIRRLGFRQPIAVVPNGIDLPDLARPPPPADRAGRHTVLFLSRIHPKKGVATLLRAWRRVELRFPDWELVVAGPDERGHLDEIQTLANALELARVSFPGPAYGTDKQALYRGADLFVLPSHSENFGLVIAEALAHRLPVITTGTPWQGLEGRDCGWWVELSEQSLAQALHAAMCMPQERRVAMGRRGRRWMDQSFGWPAIAAEMSAVYEWLGGLRAAPSSVRFD